MFTMYDCFFIFLLLLEQSLIQVIKRNINAFTKNIKGVTLKSQSSLEVRVFKQLFYKRSQNVSQKL